MNKKRIGVLLLLSFELLIGFPCFGKETWLCTEESSQLINGTIQACGVASGRDENEARSRAFDNAKAEFDKVCNASDSCRGHIIDADPKRTTCEPQKEGFKCYRAVEFQIGKRKMLGNTNDTSAPHSTDFIKVELPSNPSAPTLKSSSSKSPKAIGVMLNGKSSYDKTAWGMNIQKVRSLYPGGVVAKSQNGEREYSVIRKFIGLPTGYVTFTFDHRGLYKTIILFPKQDEAVDLTKGTYVRLKSNEAKEIFTNLKRALVLSVGQFDPEFSTEEHPVWAFRNGDLIGLSIHIDADSPEYATPAILYQRYQKIIGGAEGL